jgi:hypothetical protein
MSPKQQNNELSATVKSMTNDELRTALADRDGMIKNLSATVESLKQAVEAKEVTENDQSGELNRLQLLQESINSLTNQLAAASLGKAKGSRSMKGKKNTEDLDDRKNSKSKNNRADDVDDKSFKSCKSENEYNEEETGEKSDEDDNGNSSDSSESSDSSDDGNELNSSSADSDAVVDRRDRVKMNLPSPYKGTRTAEAVEIFISQLKSYCYLTAVPKNARVTLFKSLLVGTAKKWWKSIDRSKRHKMGFTRALNELHKEFHPELQEENARETLDRLKYYPGKFRQFKDMFRNVTFEIKDMSESEKLHVFKKKLPSDFQFEILKLRCKTVKQAMQIASELDLTQRQAGMHQDPKYSRDRRNKPNGDSPGGKVDVSAIKIDDTKQTPKKDPKKLKWVNELKALDKDVLQKRRVENLCLNCGNPDHRIDSCPGPHRRQ